jgi:hypothetical protein
MTRFSAGLRRTLSVFLAIAAVCGALFGLALLASALTGRDTPSSFLLGGFGFVLFISSALVFVYAIRQWTHAKPGGNR